MKRHRRILAVVTDGIGRIFHAHPDSGRRFRVASHYPYHYPDIIRTAREEFARVIVIQAPFAALDSILLRTAEDIIIESTNDILDLNLPGTWANVVLIAVTGPRNGDHARCYLHHVTSAGLTQTNCFGEILPETFWQSVITTAILLDDDCDVDDQE